MARKMKKPKVSMAYVHGTEVTYSWHACVMALISYDVAANQHVIGAQWLSTKYGTGGIVQARNDTVQSFLNTDSDWLFWIDTDMGFAPDTVDRLLQAADPDERPIVGGLCFMNKELGPDGMGGMLTQPVPTIFDWWKDNVGGGFEARWDYERNALLQVAGTGSACLLIHRSVFERIEAQYGKCWYSPVQSTLDGSWLSEDLSLCMRAAACEIPVHVDTRVKTSHYKWVWLDERLADRIERIEPQK
jgi:hypothetical protein